MTTLREAAQAALPWLEAAWDNGPQYAREFKPLWAVITDLRAALAEFDASLTDPTKISVHQTAEPAQPVALWWDVQMPDEVARWITAHPPKIVPKLAADVPRLKASEIHELLIDERGVERFGVELARAVEAEVLRRMGVVE